MTSVAVAVKGDLGGSRGGKGSSHAVRWAAENLMPSANRFILVHVMPRITSIPTPSGDRIPIMELEENMVSLYVQEMESKFEEVFVPFKKLCKSKKVETLVLEDDDPATALVRYVSESEINSLVLGSCSVNLLSRLGWFANVYLLIYDVTEQGVDLTIAFRKQKGSTVPDIVRKCAPESCVLYVVYEKGVLRKSVRNSSDQGMVNQIEDEDNSSGSDKYPCRAYSSSEESRTSSSALMDLGFVKSEESVHTDFPARISVSQERNQVATGDKVHVSTVTWSAPRSSSATDQSDVQAEIEQVRLELQATVSMYERTCGELVHAQNKARLLSSEHLEEIRRLNAAKEREETLRKIAAEQKAKHMAAMKEVEEAKSLLANEAYRRQIAELNALNESSEKQKVIDVLLSNDRRYRRYTKNEIEIATDNFSQTKVIGEGAYGKVYKGSLDHTPVAIKVLRSDAYEKKQEFLKEVEVLSQLRHPQMVLLLGACPENGCLVYEYLENGSLDEYISHQNTRPSLPWPIRFKIIFEVACGLAFLHNSKPEPIVHRDLKPGNILLGRNYVSKIGDVGLAKLISDIVPDNVTEYRDSVLAGTFYYMDPEYQRTGTLRPKSDLYAFGIIILQMLMSRHPKGLLSAVEDAVEKGSIAAILDSAVRDWPFPETEELACVALNCSKLRCRDRPDLERDVLPVLKRLADFSDACVRVGRIRDAPSHYYCPILQEIMEAPYIAADGFTYEHRAMEAWLRKHNVSPVTKLRLPHGFLIPNNALRSAIQEWKS